MNNIFKKFKTWLVKSGFIFLMRQMAKVRDPAMGSLGIPLLMPRSSAERASRCTRLTGDKIACGIQFARRAVAAQHALIMQLDRVRASTRQERDQALK